MNIKENESLAKHTTIQLGGIADYYLEIESKNDLIKAVEWARSNRQPVFVLGGGSNILFTDEGFRGLVVENRIKGIQAIDHPDGSSQFTIGAGENWDDAVAHTVKMGFTGIEALSMIPGTAGATPVQNVGAYGQEISETFVELEAFDTNTDQFVIMNKDDCGFTYRDSVFRRSPGRFIILNITLHLYKGILSPPYYRSLETFLIDNNINDTSPESIRKAVMTLRSEKLPDPKLVANVGSFFKNPITSIEHYDVLRKDFPDMPGYHVENGIKVPAGWLIENAGYKNFHHDNGMGTYEHHALVFVNYSAKKYADLVQFRDEVIEEVVKKFGVTLEPEPQVIDSTT